jgi:anti-anti-sigma factor
LAVETTFYAECNGENLQVVVDLSAVKFLASLGIRLLVQGLKSVKARNGTMKYLNPVPAVSASLEMAGLTQYVITGTA